MEDLAVFEKRYEELGNRLCDPAVAADPRECGKLTKEYKEIEPIVAAWRGLRKAREAEAEAREILGEGGDRELHAMAEEQLKTAQTDEARLSEELKTLLLPKDPNDGRNVIVEIRAGAGGEEAALFAAVLFHRVQRVPETEQQGRIHTSTATVAVLPEVDEVEVGLNPDDLKIDTFRSSGAGGQHINKTSSAIRVTHLPTGIVVECQDERSQYKNKDRALKILRSRLYEMKQREQDDRIAAERRSQVGTGDRSERIRTYNYPQGRVTDHRIGLTLYKLESVLDGALDEVVDALTAADRAAKLQKSEERA